MSPLRWLALALVAAALAGAGWGMLADHRRPDRDGLLAQAHAHLQDGNAVEAAAIARSVLADDPSHGRAFSTLAPALADEGDPAATLARYTTAARRAPRDIHVRAWLAAQHLEGGEFAAAVPHLDALLTVSPDSRQETLPALAQLAADRRFADALADHLAAQPRWRGQVLRAVR